MQWSRVKTIMIGMLLAVNGFLAIMLGGKTFFVLQRDQQMQRHVQAILVKKNIMLADEVRVSGNALMPQLNIDRNRTDEAAVASALLKGVFERSEDGAVSVFEGELGQVRWSENGAISAKICPEDYHKPVVSQIQASAQQILLDAGLTSAEVQWQSDTNSATARVRIAGYEVFNRNLTVHFSQTGYTIDGLWTFSEPYSTKGDFYANYNAADAILIFSRQGIAAEIQSIEPGLYLTNASANQFQVTPVWKIETSEGDFFVDMLKNTVE